MGTNMSEDLAKQKQEALGPDNKWFCSKHFGYEVTDPETLLKYYIKHGGAQNFRQRIQTPASPPHPAPKP